MTLASMMLLASGCATSGSYCDIAKPVRPSVEDSLSNDTKRQILVENQKLQKICGVKP